MNYTWIDRFPTVFSGLFESQLLLWPHLKERENVGSEITGENEEKFRTHA